VELNGSDPAFHDNGSINKSVSYPFAILLLPWTEPSIGSEVRCFIKDRKPIALSQCFDELPSFVLPNDMTPSRVRRMIIQTLLNNAKRWPQDNCIIDVDIARILTTNKNTATTDNDDTREVHIIEANPWGTASDACLFSWKRVLPKEERQKLQLEKKAAKLAAKATHVVVPSTKKKPTNSDDDEDDSSNDDDDDSEPTIVGDTLLERVQLAEHDSYQIPFRFKVNGKVITVVD
jgi:hypothetical protein